MNVEHSLSVDASPHNRRSAFVAWLKKRRWFVIFVILPSFFAAVYYGLFASDIYVSEARFVIKSPDQKRPQISSLANIIQTTGLSAGQEQTNEVLDYVRSRNALQSLVRDAGIRKRFSSPNADTFSRFPQPLMHDTFEDLFKYYGKMVDARLDSETGAAVLTVKAFTPQDAYQINQSLLNLSEALVNRLNERAEGRGIIEAQKQVDLALARVRKARVDLAGYRNSVDLIDPAKQATGVIEIANAMVGQRAALQAQLETMQHLTPANPSIPALRNRIAALSAQIAAQNGQVVGSGSGIASKMGGYENLLAEQEFATQNLNVANAALVQARSDAVHQKFYLERVVDPDMPDMPLLPHRLLSIITVIAAAICLYFIGWMLIVGILEHAPDD
ncbi:MAG TPA: capsule biosynthesis protein [Novosphingobium capsulatum]|nr:capsule biosynthesis protein [Novosphingobium capsulatum]